MRSELGRVYIRNYDSGDRLNNSSIQTSQTEKEKRELQQNISVAKEKQKSMTLLDVIMGGITAKNLLIGRIGPDGKMRLPDFKTPPNKHMKLGGRVHVGIIVLDIAIKLGAKLYERHQLRKEIEKLEKELEKKEKIIQKDEITVDKSPVQKERRLGETPDRIK